MSEEDRLRRQACEKSQEALDWMEANVIAMTAHPKGWELLIAGPDGEPATDDAELFEGNSILESVARARAKYSAPAAGGSACPTK